MSNITFARIQGYVNIVQVALCKAAVLEEPSLDTESGRRIITAMANLLVGQSSPNHTEDEKRLGRELAAKLLPHNADMRAAAVESLRSVAIIEKSGGKKTFMDYIELVYWIGTLGQIPKGPPTPESMYQLALDMANKYGIKVR